MSRREEISLKLNQLIDGTLLGALFFVAHWLRLWAGDHYAWLGEIAPFDTYLWLLAIIVPLGPIILELQGFYSDLFGKSFRSSVTQIARTMLWMALIFGLCVVFFKWIAESRAVLLGWMMMGGTALVIREAITRAIIRSKVQVERRRERVVVAGDPDDIETLIAAMPAEQTLRTEIVDRIDLSSRPATDLRDCFRERAVERVIFAADHMHFRTVEEAIHVCETEGVEAWLSADFINPTISRLDVASLGRTPMLVFRSTPDQDWSMLVKELADRVLGLLLFIVAIPLILGAMLAVKLASPDAPVIFRQSRGGRYGRPFTMFKIRTMHPGAEARRDEIDESNAIDGPAFKAKNDPRIFAFGQFLRKLSIDELPQLWNVVRGDMSLVGPRPLPTYEVEKISVSSQRRRLSVKPGLTCLWQVSGRSNITNFEEWVALDLEYIDNWSLWLDCKILARTVPAVLTGAGAE